MAGGIIFTEFHGRRYHFYGILRAWRAMQQSCKLKHGTVQPKQKRYGTTSDSDYHGSKCRTRVTSQTVMLCILWRLSLCHGPFLHHWVCQMPKRISCTRSLRISILTTLQLQNGKNTFSNRHCGTHFSLRSSDKCCWPFCSLSAYWMMCKHRCSKRDCAGHERWATAVVLSAASISEAKGVLQRNKTNKVYDLEILEDEIPAAHWANFALMGAQYVSSENSAGMSREKQRFTCTAMLCSV